MFIESEARGVPELRRSGMSNFYDKTFVHSMNSTCHSFGVEDTQNTTLC